ncbi:MAG: hypothetical protein J6K82_02275 [Alphaproteobacteria bacterium]|nr:hypothetical protein [Alphaproteobacteria bacterium]
MKRMKKIFDVLFIRAVCAAVMLCIMAGASWGAVTNYGCDDEDNGYISAELALCSTHAYNIGQATNPSNAGDKELMREVIAMKTTFITQQMYKQYEQLESVIRRLKTQLEKAVLTTNLKVAGGQTDDDSSSGGGGASYRQENRNVFMAGVSDCNTQLTTLKVFECLSTNLTTMYNVSGNGSNPTTEVRKQLAKDYEVMCNNDGGVLKDDICEKDAKNNIECTGKISGKTLFNKCIDNLRTGIRKGYEAAQRNERQMSGNRQQVGY